MPFIIPANSAVSGGDKDSSCRFDDGSSTQLHKTPSSAGNRQIWTASIWFKRSNISTNNPNLLAADAAGDVETFIRFRDSDLLQISTWNGGGYDFDLRTNRLFRDVSAWYHIVVAVKTTDGTASNRVKLYVNGVQETSFATETYPSVNHNTHINATVPQRVGTQGSTYFDGYMSEVVLIDGQQLAPTEFGEFDEDSGIWKPKAVSGLTAGTNGFYLDFKDSANLGNDAFGGTDLTEVNLTAVDQSLDIPTNNFATINSLDNYYAQATFSNGNLTVVTPVSQYAYIRSTIAASSGKWYAEMKITTASAADNQHGIVSDAAINSTGGVGERANAYGYRGSGQVVSGGSVVSYTAASYTAGDIISIAMDLDNNLIFFYKNGAIQNSGTGLAITAPASTTDGVYYFATSDNANLSGGTYQFDWNFGSPSFAISSGNQDSDGFGNFEYAVPSGYFALNTKNLSEYG